MTDSKKADNRESRPYLTKYELAKLVGKGAMLLIKENSLKEGDDPLEIALKLIKQKKLPLDLERMMSDFKTKEIWKFTELN